MQNIDLLKVEVSVFYDISTPSNPMRLFLGRILNDIKDGTYKEEIERIRNCTDEKKQQLLKKKLKVVCYSGIFPYRADKHIEKHSGLLCMDIDGLGNNFQQIRSFLLNDEYTFSLFTSPRGNGLKVLIRIPCDITNHKGYFESIVNYYVLNGVEQKYIDISCKNISRGHLVSYDPDLYINENSTAYTDFLVYEAYHESVKALVPVKDGNRIIEYIKKLLSNRIISGRNDYVLKFACFANRYGIDMLTTINHTIEMEDKDFTKKEIQYTVSQAYKRYINEKGTWTLEDVEKINVIKYRILQGRANEDIMDECSCTLEDIEVVENAYLDKFWHIDIQKNGKELVILNNKGFKIFLEKNGFFQAKYNGEILLVRVDRNIIDISSVTDIKQFVLDYCNEMKYDKLYQYLTSSKAIFKNDYLNMLSIIEVNFIKDDAEKSYLFFRNCLVEINKEDIKAVDYREVGCNIWRSNLIDKDFNLIDFSKSKVFQFINDVGGENSELLHKIIGFLCYRYKDRLFSKSVILSEYNLNENRPEGGTGKGIIINMLSQIRGVITTNGQTFNPLVDKFAFGGINHDTNIFCIDDCRKGMDVESLFPIITSDMSIRYMNKNPTMVKFEDLPKFLLVSNYKVQLTGSSFRRRYIEFFLERIFNAEYTPYDRYKEEFFSWHNKYKWDEFYSMMIHFIQLYLKNGIKNDENMKTKIEKFKIKIGHFLMNYLIKTDIMVSGYVLNFTDYYLDYVNFCKKQNERYITKDKLLLIVCEYSNLNKFDCEQDDSETFVIKPLYNLENE